MTLANLTVLSWCIAFIVAVVLCALLGWIWNYFLIKELKEIKEELRRTGR